MLTFRCDDSRLYVTSHETNELESLEFRLNSQSRKTWYSKIGPIPSNREFFIRLNDFAMDDGRRFNPFAYKVTQVWAGGSGFDFYGFTPSTRDR